MLQVPYVKLFFTYVASMDAFAYGNQSHCLEIVINFSATA